jgi:hypothetical protein
MRIAGTLGDVFAHGYERTLEVSSVNSGLRYWVATFEPEYEVALGAPCPVWHKGEHVELVLILKYVTAIKLLPATSPVGLKQPIPGSPHCEVVAKVVSVPELDSFECSIGQAGQYIKVDCEFKHNLVAGQVVAFAAELAREA